MPSFQNILYSRQGKGNKTKTVKEGVGSPQFGVEVIKSKIFSETNSSTNQCRMNEIRYKQKYLPQASTANVLFMRLEFFRDST